MKILSQITPAETMLVKDCSSVQFKDLMKFTFMDLLLKKVIEIKEINKKSHPRDKYIRTYTYVVSGKNFNKYKPKNHELILVTDVLRALYLQTMVYNCQSMFKITQAL